MPLLYTHTHAHTHYTDLTSIYFFFFTWS